MDHLTINGLVCLVVALHRLVRPCKVQGHINQCAARTEYILYYITITQCYIGHKAKFYPISKGSNISIIMCTLKLRLNRQGICM